MRTTVTSCAHLLLSSFIILLHLLKVGVLHGLVVVLRGLALLTCVGVAADCTICYVVALFDLCICTQAQIPAQAAIRLQTDKKYINSIIFIF